MRSGAARCCPLVSYANGELPPGYHYGFTARFSFFFFLFFFFSFSFSFFFSFFLFFLSFFFFNVIIVAGV